MKFECHSCGQPYTIADDKVRGRVVKIRCRACGERMEVRGDGSEVGERGETRLIPRGALDGILRATRRPPTREIPAEPDVTTLSPVPWSVGDETDPERQVPSDLRPPETEPPVPVQSWHAVVGGKQTGPLTHTEVARELRAGRIRAGTYVWTEGQAAWKPVRDVEALAALLRPGTGGSPKPEPPAPEPKAPAPVIVEAPRDRPRLELVEERDEPSEGDALKDVLAAIASEARGVPEAEAPGPVEAEPEAGEVPEAQPEEPEADPFHQALATLPGDPFDAVPDAPHSDKPRETTQMYILASGVNKRRSPLRIAAFVGGMVLVFGGMAYLLAYAGGIDLGVLPMPGRRGDVQAAGGPVDAEAAKRMRERLLGLVRDEPAPKPQVKKVAAAPTEAGEDPELPQKEAREVATLTDGEKASLSSLYGERDRGALKIKVKDAAGRGVDSTASPIDPEIVGRKIAETQNAFRGCVQEELRRNPAFKGGRIVLTLSVAPSGVVREARIDDRAIDLGDVGACIKKAGRRIMLPSFASSEAVDFQVPLVLSFGS